MMMSLWLAMAVLLLMAAAFLLWPLKHKPATTTVAPEDKRAYTDTNIALYHEHIAELEQARASGRLTDEAFEQLKLEHERALLEDEQQLEASTQGRGLAQLGSRFMLVFCLFALAASAVLYQQLGNSQDVRLLKMQQEKARLDWEDMQHQRDPDPARAEELVKALEARLAQRPDNLQYRFLLGRYAMTLGDYDRAIKAYEAVIAVDSQSPRVLAELAQALFLRDGNRMTPRIAGLAEAALVLEPKETTALGLAGINAFNEGDFQQAITYWQRAVDVLGPQSPSSRSLQGGIERARQELAGTAAEPGDASAFDEVAPKASISVRVSLSEDAEVAPEQWVFVYARTWEGSPIPLAITRLQASELPTTIILDDTMAMSTDSILSQASQVELVARASKTSTAAPQKGDWQGTVGPLDPKAGNDTIDLAINREITE